MNLGKAYLIPKKYDLHKTLEFCALMSSYFEIYILQTIRSDEGVGLGGI